MPSCLGKIPYVAATSMWLPHNNYHVMPMQNKKKHKKIKTDTAVCFKSSPAVQGIHKKLQAVFKAKNLNSKRTHQLWVLISKEAQKCRSNLVMDWIIQVGVAWKIRHHMRQEFKPNREACRSRLGDIKDLYQIHIRCKIIKCIKWTDYLQGENISDRVTHSLQQNIFLYHSKSGILSYKEAGLLTYHVIFNNHTKLILPNARHYKMPWSCIARGTCLSKLRCLSYKRQ